MFDKLKSRFGVKNKALSDLVSYSFWSVVGSLISKFLLFVVWVFVARILGDEAYGEFSSIRSTTFLFSDFVAMSLAIAANKYVAQHFGRNNEKTETLMGTLLSVSAVSGLVMFCVLFFGADYIAGRIMEAPQLTGLLKATSVVLLVSMINNCQQGILRGFGEFKTIAKINLVQIAFSFPVYIAATYFYGVTGAVCAYIFYNVVICVITQFYISKSCRVNGLRVKYGFRGAEVESVLYFMAPYFVSVLASMAGQWYNEMRLVSLGSYGFAQMGYYTVSNNVQLILMTAINIICMPYVSVLSKYSGGKDGRILEKLNMTIPIYMGAFLSVPCLLVPELLSVVYGPQYSNPDVYAITVVMTLYTVLIVYKHSLSRLAAVYEKQMLYLCNMLVLTVIMIAGFYYYRNLGALGLATVNAAAYIISSILFAPLYVKAGMMKWSVFRDGLMWAYVFAAAFAFGIYWFTDEYLLIRIAILVVALAVMGYGLYRKILTIKRNGWS